MISVLMSEGLAPSNGAKPHEPARDASRPSKDEAFSSYMDSPDDTSDVASEKESAAQDTVAAAPAETDQKPAPAGEDGSQLNAVKVAKDSAQAEPTGALNLDAEIAADDPDIAAKDTASKEANAPRTAEIVDTVKTAASAAVTAGDANLDAPVQTQAETAAPSPDGEPRAHGSEDAATIKGAPEADAEIKLDPRSGDQASADGEVTPLKFADTSGQSGDQNRGQTSLTATPEADPRLAGDAEAAPSDLVRTSELADLDARKQNAAAAGNEKLIQASVSRDGAPVSFDPALSVVAASSSSSSVGPVPTGGLAPTTPAHVIAAPSDLTNIVMNALKTGGDPQEQLVVQLDPPELGRVLIDFKFDAQGVQQITVTSENPEALKRLRELHFELTEALKQNGLSDSNLSFQQHTQDQSQSNWQAPEWGRAQSQSIAAADRDSSAASMPPLPNFQGRDRLDLLL